MRTCKVAKCGAMDSKYFSSPGQFEIDIEANKFSKELFKSRIKNIMLEEPDKLKLRYTQAVEVFTELKEEYGL